MMTRPVGIEARLEILGSDPHPLDIDPSVVMEALAEIRRLRAENQELQNPVSRLYERMKALEDITRQARGEYSEAKGEIHRLTALSLERERLLAEGVAIVEGLRAEGARLRERAARAERELERTLLTLGMLTSQRLAEEAKTTEQLIAAGRYQAGLDAPAFAAAGLGATPAGEGGGAP